ncbi:MAG: flagellar basal body L-ring protein FlgH [bacterium]|nr:flagellar basal body L-ring protein FlgH [bacterium]
MISIYILLFSFSSLFTEPRAMKVGDLVTVMISESSYGVNRAETVTNKSDNVSFGVSQENLAPATIPVSLSGGVSTNNDHNGRGRSIKEDKLVAYITATVTEVMPNGNLKIEGEKKINLNQDAQIIKVSGVVRADDIETDNYINSNRLANAKIEYKGKGAVESGQKRGFLMKLFDWIF